MNIIQYLTVGIHTCFRIKKPPQKKTRYPCNLRQIFNQKRSYLPAKIRKPKQKLSKVQGVNMDKEQKGKAAASETTAQPPQNAALLANRYYQVHSAESSQKKCFFGVFGRFFVRIPACFRQGPSYLCAYKALKNQSNLRVAGT